MKSIKKHINKVYEKQSYLGTGFDSKFLIRVITREVDCIVSSQRILGHIKKLIPIILLRDRSCLDKFWCSEQGVIKRIEKRIPKT